MTSLQIPVRLSLSGEMRAGNEVEVRLMLGHVMETGFRHDSSGQPVARNILVGVTLRLDETMIFEAELGTGMAANPMLFFPLVLPTQAGTLVVDWVDDQGRSGSLRKLLLYA